MKLSHLVLAPLTVLSLSLAGCASGEAQPSTTPADDHDHEHGEATETAVRSPRIVVVTDDGVVVLDQEMKALDTFAVAERPTLSVAHNERHVIAAQYETGVASIIDAGSWGEPHGDHFHYFVSEPELFGETLEGERPVHVVGSAEAGVTAVYFDGLGEATLVTSEALEEEELHGLKKISADIPHHGLVAPLADGTFIVSQAADSESLPDSLDHIDANGEAIESFDCKKMHGEAVHENQAAFGCIDGVLIVEGGAQTRIANPDDSDERVGNVAETSDGSTHIADWAADSLIFIADGKGTLVEVGVEYGGFAVTPDDQVAVLGTDGVLRIYDTTGAEVTTFKVVEPWTRPEGHFAVMPAIATGEVDSANVVWVTDPAANKLHAVDLFSNEITSVDLAGQPGGIVVANAS